MKSNQVRPEKSAYHDEPSNVKLQSVLEQRYQESRIHQIQLDIFQYLGVKFKINEITINAEQFVHTVFVETQQKQMKGKCIFLGHGFGGSSLMYFPIVNFLLQLGNVVMWQIRGMGLSRKLSKYSVSLQDSQDFFVKPIQKMLKYYHKYKQIFFISHSFGGYLTLLYILRYKTFHSQIKQVILLSPVGITPKQQDYKSKINSCSDLLHVIGNKLSWGFHITYKSPFRCICACLKNKVFEGAVKDCAFSQQEKKLMKQLLIAMVELEDGSQNVFFHYFQPRVLPKFPILPIFVEEPPFPIKILYGGEEDWVDKTGAQRIREKFPSKINIEIVEQCGHNFPFFPVQLKQTLNQIFYASNNNKNKNLQKQKPNLNSNQTNNQNFRAIQTRENSQIQQKHSP